VGTADIVWTETAKDGEWICKENSVTELSEFIIIIIIISFCIMTIFDLSYDVLILINFIALFIA
jgi:hypothetical protein